MQHPRLAFAFPFALIAGLAAASAHAQGVATPLADLNPVLAANPTSAPRFGAGVASGAFVFAARTAACGTEPWIVTSSGTSPALLRDLTPGVESSNPHSFTSHNGIVLFAASDGSAGTELWRTDGTLGGTYMLKDIEPGAFPSSPSLFVPFAGRVFFRATSGGDTELWATDGTAAGTVRVDDVRPGSTSSFPVNLTVVGSTLFFRASQPTGGWELWKSDGTAAGTVAVAVIQPSGIPDSSEFAAAGSELFFTAWGSTTGHELWRSDGATVGVVRDIVAGPQSSAPVGLTAMGGAMYFAARLSPTSGYELWKSDGTTVGTVLVRDIFAGSGGSTPSSLLARGNRLFFSADDGVSGRELWVSDGTAAGTTLVADVRPGSAGSDPAGLILDEGPGHFVQRIVFSADDGVNGRELWRSTGTAAGTALAADVRPGAAGSSPDALFALPGSLRAGAVVCAADDGVHGVELCRVDGTVVNVFDLNPPLSPSNPRDFVSDGRKTFFVANDGVHGDELWVSDGTTAGTRMVLDVAAGSASSSPRELFLHDGVCYCSMDTPANGFEPWRSDGTAAGTYLLRDVRPGTANGVPTEFTVWNGQIWFVANDGATGRELHRTDGTPAGTVLGVDVVPGAASAEPRDLAVFQGRLWFGAQDATYGRELWSSDGTPGGTAMLRDLETGTGSSDPRELTPLGATLLFSAGPAYSGRELFVTDGTWANTLLLTNIASFSQSSHPSALTLAEFTPGAPRVCFVATSAAAGEELYVTDGTAAGTLLLRDVQVGAGSSEPRGLTRLSRPGIGDQLAFAARDDGGGLEPWITGGTPATTRRIRDVLPGQMSSMPPAMTPVPASWFFAAPGGRQVLFAANSGITGLELWRYDVDADSLAPHQDVRAGFAGSNPGKPVLVGSRLVFAADDGTGHEPWVMTSMAAQYPYGEGCAGPAGVPALTANGAPSHGNATFGYRLANSGPTNVTFLLLDFQRSAQPFGPCTVWCQPLVALFGVSDGAGVSTYPLSISPDPVWAGLAIDAQGLVFAPGGAIGGVAVGSNGLEILVGR